VLLDLYLSNRLEAVSFPVKNPFAANLAKGMSERDRVGDYARFAMTDDYVSPRALPGQEGGIHTVTGLEHSEAGRPRDTPEVHIQMTEKRHKKLASAVHHPELTIAKRFGDEGKVDVGILAWGSTFGEGLEAMIEARNEGIRCAAMKVVMLSPLPVDAIRSFCQDCREVIVPELNYQGQFANLVTAATACAVHRLNRVSGRPMHVEDILSEIRRLGSSKRQIAAA
jgi:2-oxoglutarate ferredoxin oxidoreductase subunit alpha